MEYLIKLTSLTVLAAGLAAVPLTSAESGHVDGPHPEHQSLHTKKSAPHPPEARRHKVEPLMKRPLGHAVKKMPKRHRHCHGRQSGSSRATRIVPNRYVKNIGFTALEFKSERQQHSKQLGSYETIDIRKPFQRELLAGLDINGRITHCKKPPEIFQATFPHHNPAAV